MLRCALREPAGVVGTITGRNTTRDSETSNLAENSGVLPAMCGRVRLPHTCARSSRFPLSEA